MWGDNGKKILDVELFRALYGFLFSALLFYWKLQGNLELYGFAVNPYNPYVTNKLVNGSQITIVWHVENLKISHTDPAEVTELINYLEKIYGKMAVHRGEHLTYLGMDLYYINKGEVFIAVSSYIKEALEEFPEEDLTPASIPASDHLFKLN